MISEGLLRSLQGWCRLLTPPAQFLSGAKANTRVLWVGISDCKATEWPQLQGAAGLSGIDQTSLWEGLWVLWVDGEGGLPVLMALGDPSFFFALLPVKRCHC